MDMELVIYYRFSLFQSNETDRILPDKQEYKTKGKRS